MSRNSVALCGLLLSAMLACPARSADPATFNPLKGFVHSPLHAEAEVYVGGITGQNVGSAFRSAAQGDYGLRFTFGFLKSLDFSVNYLYSNQTRTLIGSLPSVGGLPAGTVVARAANMNIIYGNGEFNLLNTGRGVLYISPGLGFARNASRNLTVATPLGSTSFPISAGNAVTFNLGAGVKIFPRKRWGIRLDARDFVSGGGSGDFNPHFKAGLLCPIQNPSCQNPGQFLGSNPINNNIVFTVGLIYKLL